MKTIYALLSAAVLSLNVCGQAAEVPLYRFSVENMWVINSSFSEMSLMPLNKDAYVLVSDRGGLDPYGKWTGGSTYDIYFINRGDWTDIIRPPVLNTAYSDGPVAVLPDGALVVTGTNHEGVTDPKTGLTVYSLNLYDANSSDGSWNVKAIPEFKDRQYSYMHPTLSTDGTMMIMSSNLPGGFGGMDLYASYFMNDRWSGPVNLGSEVNSAGNETFPFLHKDGSLYFASDGFTGFGGTDIYVTRKENRRWTKPLNLGEPLNSRYNESSAWFNDEMERGFVTSDRPGGKGGEDVYAIFIDKIYDLTVRQVETVENHSGAEKGTAADDTRDIPAQDPAGEAAEAPGRANTAIAEADLTTGEADMEIAPETQVSQVTAAEETVGNPGAVAEEEASRSGRNSEKEGRKERSSPEAEAYERAVIPAPAIEEDVIAADMAGAAARGNDIEDLPGQQRETAASEVEREIPEPIAAAGEIAAGEKDAGVSEIEKLENARVAADLSHVFFGMGSAELDAEDEKVLDQLAGLLNKYTTPVLELHARADATGDPHINIRLSELRARSVIQYLNKKGIPVDRMCYMAYGEGNPTGSQESAGLSDRRVEIRFRESAHAFKDAGARERVEGLAYKQLPMLSVSKYYIQLVALSEAGTFSTYKLKEYGAAMCFLQGGLYKYALGPFDTLEQARGRLTMVKQDYRDAFIFKNE